MRELNSFSCLHCVVTFFIAIQPWTWTTRSGYTGLMTAAATAKSPGEIDPTSLSILIGGNANITCRLSKPNSSQIWFLEEKTKLSIKQPSDNIKIIDQYTAVLTIHDAREQNSRYQCKFSDYAIGVSELYVGTKPLNITDFSCITYDYALMNCSFTIPKNMILTSYDLKYKLLEDSSIHNCSCSYGENYRIICNVTDYMPMRDKYLFTLKGKNDVGENTQIFKISNYKSVIPSAVDIIKENVTSESIWLSWEILKYSYYKAIGLIYDIQIRDNNSGWRNAEVKVLDCQNGTCSMLINNLYAFWIYWIKVRVKSKAVDNDDFWSKERIIKLRTRAVHPKRAPKTPLGGFYIDSTETQLRLYWEHMPEHEHNGPGFHYVVNEINDRGEIMFSTKCNESSSTFAWKNESKQTFIIKSANEKGESTDGNIIHVYRSGSSSYELNENSIAKVYHNRSYTLSWTQPENIEELTNYTVFWCLPKIELPNQCKGPISYKYLNNSATNFTTEPKDRSLNLAISANYPHYSKGMQWARCSADISSELMKMELEVSALSESSILIKWGSGSVCASILKGYNLTYCQATMDDKCITAPTTVELLREKKEFRNYTISHIPSYTNVCLYMFMYSPSKQGRISDLNCIRTKASAPLPPNNVEYTRSSITSKSAKIQWSPPSAKNGILSHYTIYWRKYPDYTFEKNTIAIDQTSYNLTGLNSYSNYELYVTAHTIKESLPSQRINFTTLIGIPSGPRNLNIYENDTVIYWDKPDLPSGRHLFYVIALIRRDDKFNEFYERVSIVKGRSCRFQEPDCLNSNKSNVFKVRAVNVGGKDEVDREIVAMNKDVILAGAPIDNDFCKSEEDTEGEDISNVSIFLQENGKFYFASPWIVAPRSYSCSVNSKVPIYVVSTIIIIAFAAYIFCWLRNKIYNMKNIKVILPEGLANYKYATDTIGNGSELGSTTKKEFHSGISRSNDCLVACGHKEIVNLITNFQGGSTKALSSFSSSRSSKDQPKDEQFAEHNSLETTNEELSSNSSSVSNSNITYNDHQQIRRLPSIDSNNTVPASACEEEDLDVEFDANNSKQFNDEETLPQFASQQNNGYVTHNSQLLASILSATERNPPTITQFNSTFSTMTNDGYIQPSAAKQLFQPSFAHHQQPPATNINGYTCIESLNKLTTPDESRHINNSTQLPNMPVSNNTTTSPFNGISMPATNVSSNILASLHTSPVITDLNESPSTEYNKDPTQPNGTTVVSTTGAPHHQHNNNNIIYGYVTQQQLATFGTNVALGKELNTT